VLNLAGLAVFSDYSKKNDRLLASQADMADEQAVFFAVKPIKKSPSNASLLRDR